MAQTKTLIDVYNERPDLQATAKQFGDDPLTGGTKANTWLNDWANQNFANEYKGFELAQPQTTQPIKSLSTDELTNPVSNTELADLSKATEANVFNGALNSIKEYTAKLNSAKGADPELRQKVIDSYNQTDEEKALQNNILSAKSQYDQDVTTSKGQILGLEGQGRGIPLGLIRGQQQKMYQDNQIELERQQKSIDSMVSRLGVMTADRENNRAGYQTMLEFDQQDRDTQLEIAKAVNEQNMTVVDLFSKYTSSQKEKMQSIMDSIQGIDPSTLDISTLNAVANAASAAGISGTDAIKALQAQYDTFTLAKAQEEASLKKANQKDTTITEKNGRNVLIDSQTGEVISDLGSASSGSSGGGSGSGGKQEDISIIAEWLDGEIGKDGKVSPEDFQEARRKWIGLGYSSSDFDNYFSGYINQTHAGDYGEKWYESSSSGREV